MTYALFLSHACVAHGDATTIAAAAALRARADDPHAPLLAFDLSTGRLADLDAEGALPPPPARPRGRPRLGVIGREVTLLPRHWDWLNRQRGGASVALRRLIDAARREGAAAERERMAREAAYHLLQALAGNLPRYEEALRALFAGDMAAFSAQMAGWPADIAALATALARGEHLPADSE